ncbi:hypothetical protein BH11CYA1_BH11CYA1_38860 [soil metagenome]
MRETENDASRERQISKPEQNKETNNGLDLVSLSRPGDKAAASPDKSADNPDKSSDSKRIAGIKSDDAVTHLDFTPDPYKSADMSKISDQTKGDQPKSVDERLADGRKAMENLSEKHMTQLYPSIFDGKKYQYAPTFKQDMDKLEGRMKDGQVSKEEVAKTYESIAKMVDTKTDVTSQGKRLQLAKNIMFHAGDPTRTDQGEYNTCALTSQEERLFTRNPSKAAEMISEAVTTGKWVAPDGKEIKLDKDSLQPRPGSIFGQPIDGERSYATQVLNNVLANDIHQRKEQPEHYVQQYSRDKTGRRLREDDNGERVYTADGKEARDMDGSKLRAPQVDDREVAAQIKRLTGDTGVVMVNQKMLDPDDPNLKRNAAAAKDVVLLSSERQLGDTLANLKAQGKFPAIIGLDGGDRVLSKGLPKDPSMPKSTEFEGHMLSVVDYDAAKNRARISNQWGKASDRWMSVKDLYLATDPEHPRR